MNSPSTIRGREAAPPKRPRPLPPATQREWIECAQRLVAGAIFNFSQQASCDLAMQGGSALRLFYGAPRYSMDMDFVIREDHVWRLNALIRPLHKQIEDQIQKELGPGFTVRLKGGPKPGKQLVRHTLTIENASLYLGAANLHMEFWPVDHDYMRNYTQKRATTADGTTINRADEQSINTPTLKGIYIDKVIALSSRTHIKWRDIYDVWWISSKLRNWLPEPENAEEMTAMFIAQASAYDVGDPELALQGLRRFLDTDTEVLIDQAQAELVQFLDAKTFAEVFVEEGIRRVVDRSKLACEIVHDNLQSRLEGLPSWMRETSPDMSAGASTPSM
jgi:hypothetical protein